MLKALGRPVADPRLLLGDGFLDPRHRSPIALLGQIADRIDEFRLVGFVGHDGFQRAHANSYSIVTQSAPVRLTASFFEDAVLK